jgi:hypothetical protein
VTEAGDGEQHLVSGKVDRDAARRMAGNGHGHGAVAEAEFVALCGLAVNSGRHRWLRWFRSHPLAAQVSYANDPDANL